jgi:hypothetical protein
MFASLKKLSGWQRIGVVLSVAWAIGEAGWGFYIAYDAVRQNYSNCTGQVDVYMSGDANERARGLEKCDLNRVK